MKAESSKVTKRRLSQETLQLIRQRRIARAACNRELTSELAKQGRGAIREDLEERRAAVMVEAAEAPKGIRKVPPKLRQLQDQDGCTRTPKQNSYSF
uniref:Uncharacterized protein n=1 Tax=Angiostrongylus cantonensis TaxID=6313 RepID=A0A0K0DR85_ANGCA